MNGARRPIWREPVTWLAAGLPLLTLAAIVATVRVAGHDTVDASHADTRRIAQVQIEDLSADTEAARRGLSATVATDPSNGSFVVTLQGDADASDALGLVLVHPIDAALDRRVPLLRDGRRWFGMATPSRPPQAWGLELVDAAQGWRLKGRLDRDASRATLRPAVSP